MGDWGWMLCEVGFALDEVLAEQLGKVLQENSKLEAPEQTQQL